MDFKVFPATLIQDGDKVNKVPLIKGWQQAATNNPEQIKLWENIFRDRLKFWGIPTGQTNGIFALDIDVKNSNGWDYLKQQGHIIPDTLRQNTPSGGAHFLFKTNPGIHYPNTVNQKTGIDTRGDGGWIAYYNFINDKPLLEAPDWLLKRGPAPVVEPQASTVKVSPEIAQGIIETALETIRDAPEGESNDILNTQSYILGQLIASQSITREYAEAALFRAAKERGKPDYEAMATIRSGLDGGGKKPLTSPFGDAAPVPSFPIPPPPEPEERWTPRCFTDQELHDTTSLRKPQLFKHWSTEDIHITTADGGTGKTTLKLYEAICLALGVPFLGFQCTQPGKTLFITGEDTKRKLGAMIGVICRDMGLFNNNPGNNELIKIVKASVIVKKDADMCLIAKDRQNFLHANTMALKKVMEAVEDIKPKMIVFDPISSFWGSESMLNDMNKAVSKFMSSLAEQSGACVEMINHMGKQSSANKDMGQFAGRGGTGLPSHSRVSRVLRPVDEKEYLELTGDTLDDQQSCIMCNVNKFTDGSPLYMKPFLVIREGFNFRRKSLTDMKVREEEQKLSDVARVFAFIKEARNNGLFPTRNVVKARFMADGELSLTKLTNAINMLVYQGHMGELIKEVENPDAEVRDQCFIITDKDGTEL